MGRSSLFIFLTFLWVTPLLAQDSVKTATVIPGEQYRAGAIHRFFFGGLWRDLWTTPIQVPILDLRHFAGGLTPTKLGGGLQTKSLQMKGADGKTYKFRSVNKDTRKVLSSITKASGVDDAVLDSLLAKSDAEGIMQDLISTLNPCGALIVPPLLNAVDILHAEPILFVLPDDTALGTFRPVFAGMLGILEEKPTVAKGEDEGFGGAEKVISTEKLFKKLEEDNDNQVDPVEFLKARLVDILIGDWDRHIYQWNWAGYSDGKKWTYKPIPNDRDQAFCRYDGIIPFEAAQYVPQIEGCNESYPWIADLTWSGTFLDRKLLSSVEKPVYDSLARFIMIRITDSLISASVHKIPEPMYVKEGANLERVIKARRDKLDKAADEYYRNLARFVDIRLSHKNEYAEITRLDDKSVDVTVNKRDKNTGEKKGEPIFHRTFKNAETEEVRLYLFDGDDHVLIRGDVNSSIKMRIVSGDGKKEVIDSSLVHGYFLHFTPIPKAETKTIFYPGSGTSALVTGASTYVDESEYTEPPTDSLRWEPAVKDWGHSWVGYPWIGYSSDAGIFLGLSTSLYNYSFRADPYQSKMTFYAGYAINVNRYRAGYLGIFPNVWGGTISLFSRVSSLEVLNYFGAGNETTFDPGLYHRYFYHLNQLQFVVTPKYERDLFFKGLMIWGSAGLTYFRTDSIDAIDKSIIKGNQSYGLGSMFFTPFSWGLTYDSRDIPAAPLSGAYISLASKWTPKFLDNSYPYTRITGDVRTYIPIHIIREATFALRARGEKIFGISPFFESAFLGGLNDLRGYARERFAGDASLLGSAEFRLGLGYYSFLVPGIYGISLFGESGRVFSGHEISTIWHGAVGGGIWIAPLGRANTISFQAGYSKELTVIYFSTGFSF